MPLLDAAGQPWQDEVVGEFGGGDQGVEVAPDEREGAGDHID